MEQMTDAEAFRKAVEYWGIEAQLDMVVEECAELIQAVQKIKRHGINPETLSNVITEIADMRIMLEQMRVILDHDGMWDEAYGLKIKRLKQRLEEHDGE